MKRVRGGVKISKKTGKVNKNSCCTTYLALNALIFKLVYVLIEQEFLEMFKI